jgi:hypothetical protein
LIPNFVPDGPEAIAELEALPFIGELSLVRTQRDNGVGREEGSRILGDDKISPCGKLSAIREREGDRIGQLPSRQVNPYLACVPELDELGLERVVVRVVMNLIDDHVGSYDGGGEESQEEEATDWARGHHHKQLLSTGTAVALIFRL